MEQSLSPDGLSKRVISRSVISLLSATRKFRVIFRIAATSGRMGCNEDCEGWDDDDRRRSTCGGPELRVGSKPLQCDQSRSRPLNAGAIRGNPHWHSCNRHRACDSQSWQQSSRPIQPTIRPEPLMAHSQSAISSVGANVDDEKSQTRPEHPRNGNTYCGSKHLDRCSFVRVLIRRA
jgi:hypothetical protein